MSWKDYTFPLFKLPKPSMLPTGKPAPAVAELQRVTLREKAKHGGVAYLSLGDICRVHISPTAFAYATILNITIDENGMCAFLIKLCFTNYHMI